MLENSPAEYGISKWLLKTLALTCLVIRVYTANAVVSVSKAHCILSLRAPINSLCKVIELADMAVSLNEDVALPMGILQTCCNALQELILEELPIKEWPLSYFRDPNQLCEDNLWRFSLIFLVSCWTCVQTKEKGLAKKVIYDIFPKHDRHPHIYLSTHRFGLWICRSWPDVQGSG